MRKFSMDIACDNAAFDGDNLGQELRWVLANVARGIGAGDRKGSVRDSNGNIIGTFRVTED